MNDDLTYIVTDGEFDGPIPGKNSMLSFASVAITAQGKILGEFEAVLALLEDATQSPETMAFWQSFPESYAAATQNPEPAAEVMPRFAAWVRSLPGSPVFVSHPSALDGPWIDFYLKRYTADHLFEGPWKPTRLFKSAPLCLLSFVAAKLKRPITNDGGYPPEWLGNTPHTHRAIDDARGYANLLVYLMNFA